MKKAILAVRESIGGNLSLALANIAKHQRGVRITPITLDRVALNKAAPASPPLFAVNTVDENTVLGRMERNSKPGWRFAGNHRPSSSTMRSIRTGEIRKILL